MEALLVHWQILYIYIICEFYLSLYELCLFAISESFKNYSAIWSLLYSCFPIKWRELFLSQVYSMNNTTVSEHGQLAYLEIFLCQTAKINWTWKCIQLLIVSFNFSKRLVVYIGVLPLFSEHFVSSKVVALCQNIFLLWSWNKTYWQPEVNITHCYYDFSGADWYSVPLRDSL